jgi:hypothetical protein
MNNWTTFKQLMKPALLVALLGGMSLLATSNMLVSQQGDSRTGDGDHGDNPVVGSLPCYVEPELDLMFGGNAASAMFPVPTLAMVGSTDLSNQIFDADGVPYGLVNRGGLGMFTILGLENPGTITVSRSDAAKAYMQLRQWVPDAYIGGSITMVSSIGNPSRMVIGNNVDLPITMIAGAPGPLADARITIKGPTSNEPSLVIYISAVGDLLTVTYVP